MHISNKLLLFEKMKTFWEYKNCIFGAQNHMFMNSFFQSSAHYLLNVLTATGIQLFILFGPLLLLAFMMNYVARLNENLSYKVFGRTVYLYTFGWLGTSVHELGHALFALLFGHTINDMVLFSPNAEGGSLGHVNHSYNKKNIYQSIGNFFIGIGPILLGSMTLFIITYVLYQYNILQNTFTVSLTSFLSFDAVKYCFVDAYQAIMSYFNVVFLGGNANWWRITILLFFLYSVGSSITLSPADVKSASRGFLYFVIVLLVFNIITLWIGNFMQTAFISVSSWMSVLYFLILLSIVVNMLFIVVLAVLAGIKSFLV